MKKCPNCKSDMCVTKQNIVSCRHIVLVKPKEKFRGISLNVPVSIKRSKEAICYNCGYYEPKSEDKQINAIYEQIISQRIKNDKGANKNERF